MTQPILSLRNVTKAFGGLTAVNSVSFDVTAGSFVGIAGPNGSGKSTLFNVMTRIPFGPTKGEVIFGGTRIDAMAPQKIARLGLARTFQKDVEFPDLTARETVATAATYGAQGTTDASAAVFDLVGFATGRLDMATTDLSVYERKQLMIASAMVMQPKVLMLDEPASGLTRPEIAALEELLVRINETGVTVLLIEHVLGLLMAVSQRLIVLNHGSVLADGDPKTVMKDPAVITAYLGDRAA